jgi:hypothetical protein
MLHLPRALLACMAAAIAALLCAAAPAFAAPVVQVDPDGRTHVVQEPALPDVPDVPAPGAAAGARPSAPAPSVLAAKRSDPVRSTILKTARNGGIDAAERAGYLRSWSSALAAGRRLSGQRKAELGYVIGVVRRLAKAHKLGVRLRPVFLVLDRNREWWTKSGPPASGARLRFGASRVIFQYFPGKGLQFHPLANFGQANGYWYAHRSADLRSLLNDLISLAVERPGFITWEYYFDFGGSPPWISGMAQGTALQALARAGQRLRDPVYSEAAKRGLGAFQRNTPVGVHASDGAGDWYPLYSFAPHLNVLNGMLQAVNGIRTYADITADATAQRLFEAGDRTARRVIGSYDTGAWSLYNRPGGSPGAEASLNYHTLNRDFARNLCNATKAESYCTAAAHFTKYLKEDPALDPAVAVPAPARAGRGVKFRFTLSKISRVNIVVKSESGRTYLGTGATFSHGRRYFRWVPPRAKRERTYSFSLFARDLAGNTSTAKGDVRVLPAKSAR